MSQSIDRRSFLNYSLATAAGFAAAPLLARAQSSATSATQGGKLQVASIGCGGMGGADLRQISSHSRVEIVALCDVDRKRAADAFERFPDAKVFTDYREMFDALGDRLDAVHVSTPDHTHAAATMMALNEGKHVYCQKPLTHDIYEARVLAEMAKKKPELATQMGTQNTARVGKQQAIEVLSDPEFRERTIGRVVRIYAWSDRPVGWWPQGLSRPEGSDPVPETLDWDLWLGTAPERPYVNNRYAPFNWRGCFDFGCGALGDMACHILDAPYYGLGLGHATSVVSHNEDSTDDQFPNRQDLILVFPGNDASGGEQIPLYWTDGGVIPHWKAMNVPADVDVTDNATVIVGEKGSILVPHPEGTPRLFVPDESPEAEGPFRERDIEDLLPHFEERNHYHHWVDRALGGEQTACPFEVSGPMTEALCLGALAARFPHEMLKWDAESMKFTNKPEADEYVKREYRSGFEVENL